MAAPFRLHLEVLGDDVINRRLLRFASKARDMRGPFTKIVRLLAAAEQRQFSSEGSFGGEAWAPLADSTVRQKSGGGGILEDTGRLLNSLVEGGVAGAGDAVRRVTPTELVFGTNVPYAAFHQQGTSRMPQRKVVALPETEKRVIMKVIQRELVEGFDDKRGVG